MIQPEDGYQSIIEALLICSSFKSQAQFYDCLYRGRKAQRKTLVRRKIVPRKIVPRKTPVPRKTLAPRKNKAVSHNSILYAVSCVYVLLNQHLLYNVYRLLTKTLSWSNQQLLI